MQSGVSVDPEQLLPRSFPGGFAAQGDAASIFEGLMLAAEGEHISSVSTKGKHGFPSVQKWPGSFE